MKLGKWLSIISLAIFLITVFLLASPKPSLARFYEGDTSGTSITNDITVRSFVDACKNGLVTRESWTIGCNGNSLPNSIIFALTQSLVPISPQSGQVSFKSGAIPTLASLTENIAFANPPASGVYYFAYLGKNLGIDLIPSTYAASGQGIGFSAFYSVLKIWRVMANIAYGLLAIIFVVIGFLIMFRSKLNSQIEITIQTALPRLIVTMVLIAFSYPIAGLLVDLMYLIIYAVVGFLGSSGLLDTTKTLGIIFSSNPLGLVLKGFTVSHHIAFQISSGGQDVANQSLQTLIGTSLVGIVGWLVKIGGGVFLWFLLLFFLLYIALHIFITMLKAYAYILMYVALAPIYILGNAFPGSSAFSSWLKTLIAKLLIFPVIIFHFILAAILVGGKSWGASGSLVGGSDINGWSPPLFNFSASSKGAEAILALVAVGILYIAPKAAETTENLVKGQLNLNMDQAIGGAFNQISKPVQDWRQKHEAETTMRKFAEETAKLRGGGG